MIELNLQNTYIYKKEVLSYQKKITKILQNDFVSSNEVTNDYMGWNSYEIDKKELNKITDRINYLQKDLDVEHLVVIGIGGSYLGAQAAIDFVKGKFANQNKIIFAGINLSSSHFLQIKDFLENKKWSLVVISKSGETLETLTAFEFFRNLLQNLYGEDYFEYIDVITGNQGFLNKEAKKNRYKVFDIPQNIGGRFSVLTPVGLFPMIFAGLDVKKLLEGVKLAKKDLAIENLEENTAFTYAAIRNIEFNSGINVELFSFYQYDLEMLGEWIKQLFGESEGKKNMGLLPYVVMYTRDLHSLGQTIQEGKKIFFETSIWVEKETQDLEIKIKEGSKSISLNNINEIVLESVSKAHYEQANIDNLIIKIQDRSEKTLGYLFYWFFIVVTISAFLLKVNPFNQPGVEVYKKNIKNKLDF